MWVRPVHDYRRFGYRVKRGTEQWARLYRIHLITPHLTITINNISQVIVFVNTYWQYILDKLFVMRYLTTYIYSDILVICHTRKRKRSQYSVVPDAVTSGFPVTLIKNPVFVRIQSAIAHIGKSQEDGASLINKR